MLESLINEKKVQRRWTRPFSTRKRQSADLEASIMDTVLDTVASRRFLAASAGIPIPAVISIHQKTYLEYIHHQAEDIFRNGICELMYAPPDQSPAKMDKVFDILTGVVECANTTYHFGIDETLEHLVDRKIFAAPALESPLQSKARATLFLIISWICMIYSPEAPAEPFALRMKADKSCDLDTTALDVAESQHSICETIQKFGSLLPVKGQATDADSSEKDLYVSQLNYRSLSKIGKVRIVWVDNISSHLAFDPKKRILMIFALPSFCTVYETDHKTLSKIVSGYYDSYSQPDAFSVKSYLREVLASYHLIFGDESKAASLFKDIIKGAEDVTGIRDPYFDHFVEQNTGVMHSAGFYDQSNDFPILGPRLAKLQSYMLKQDAGTFGMLWYDRRSLLQWYTIWSVITFGGLSVFLTLIQIGIGAAQIQISLASNGTIA
ncbi:hypothetical protein B0A52_02381 [Exophiala mesophila]|uniref:Uncharacterized protein n=1 Tax=Exophiala mesophila TaxID=212818 RepID=A0A438NBV9_EXOME|nr:hypothetical protein B0A52_02381 [Exophiala mesophila]